MRRILISNLVFGVGLGMIAACGAMAQMPAQQQPSMPQTAPNQSPSTGANNPGTVPAETTQNMPTKVDDKKFAKEAALGGMTEVELGKLATQKASSDAVKQLGQKMVDDHTKANDQLKQIAGKENLTVPDSLDAKHQSRVDKLSKLSGPAFDKAFIKDAVKDHEHDVSAFQSEAQSGSDPQIKQFASNTLPTLQDHLNMAKGLSKTEKKNGTN